MRVFDKDYLNDAVYVAESKNDSRFFDGQPAAESTESEEAVITFKANVSDVLYGGLLVENQDDVTYGGTEDDDFMANNTVIVNYAEVSDKEFEAGDMVEIVFNGTVEECSPLRSSMPSP